MLVGNVKISHSLRGYPVWRATFHLLWRERLPDGRIVGRSEKAFSVPWNPTGRASRTDHRNRDGRGFDTEPYRARCDSLVLLKSRELGLSLDMPLDVVGVPLDQAAEEYLRLVAATKALSTIRHYTQAIRDFVAYCREEHPEPPADTADLRRTHVARWRDKRSGYWNWHTVRIYSFGVQGFCDWLVANDRLGRLLTVLPKTYRKRKDGRF